jgi:hypothetical protein
VSRFEDGFLYKGGQTGPTAAPGETFGRGQSAFFAYDGRPVEITTGGTEARPFRHINLWARKLASAKELEVAGIYDPQAGLLNLRGFVNVNEAVTLGSPGRASLTVRGQGGIIAPSIRILSGLEKESGANPEPICILFSRDRPLEVDTASPISASLIAMGKPGTPLAVRANQPLRLTGALAADHLDSARWTTSGDHILTYDPLLKSSNTTLFQINLSRWITFQRILESDAEEGAGT